MPDPEPTTTPTPEPAKTPEPKREPEPKADKPLGKDGKEFDPDRAQHTIETLRAESKAREDKIKELEKKQKEYDDANLTESERLKKTAEEKGREAADLATSLQDTRLKLAVYVASSKPELSCADPGLALLALDRSKIKYDESGEPTNIEDELGALLEAKPILKGEPGKPTAPSVNAGEGARPGPAPKLTTEQLEQADQMGGTDKYVAYQGARTIDEMLAVDQRVRQATSEHAQAGGSQKQ